MGETMGHETGECRNCQEVRGPDGRSSWGPGPWQTEPDRVEFRHAGFPCVLHRAGRFGHWCGYVGVPPGHPAHGKGYGDVEAEVHGGLTYTQACEGHVCHIPEPGESDAVWWLGFDCGHAFDLSPGTVARDRMIGFRPSILDREETYRDVAYVRRETERLAEQLAAQVPAA